ncbi:MAG: VTT domain-containing protein [Chloroflexi bacterium]|nr:VTT domain-containing protein [Chloroflexota bacterium]
MVGERPETIPAKGKLGIKLLTWRGQRLHLLIPAGALILTILIYLLRDRVGNLQDYGYIGVFLINLIGSGAVVLPVPGLAAVFTGGLLLDPWIVALLAGTGMALGEITGYALGYGGQVVLENWKGYPRMKEWMRHRGDITLVIASLIPNPLFDAVGIVAGALRFPLWRFLVMVWVGKTLKSLVVAYLGAWGGTWTIKWIERLLG